MQVVVLPPLMTVAVDIVAWASIHFMIGYITWRLPLSAFASDGWLTRIRDWERHGRFYRDVLFIDRWKRFLPEAGDFFPGGFSKKRLQQRDMDYLRRFSCETRRGELTHWLSITAAPLFFLWNDVLVGLCMIAYALAFNLPFIAINRYNRGRLKSILGRRLRGTSGTVDYPAY